MAMTSTRTRTTTVIGLCVCAGSGIGGLQTPPRPPTPVYNGADIAAVNATIERFGFDFVTVGAPGNRSWLPSEWGSSGHDYQSSLNHIDDRGRVDYEYRIMRTEVVQTQYVDFVRAFRPFWRSIENIPNAVETGSPVAPEFSGPGISIFGGFDVNHAYDNSAVTISWRNAARYANWLHNGAPTDAAELSWDTFHTGAYTFTEQSFTSTRGSPITRNADARFWLPGLDEFLKAAYYDPDRYGEGQEGYWPYPGGSATPPAFGPPGVGDWGYDDDDTEAERLTVGRYPGTVSPWGLIDVVGTAEEWVETPGAIGEFPDGAVVPLGRLRVGLTAIFPGLIDEWHEFGEGGNLGAFRLATIVPSPAGALWLAAAATFAARRRR